MISFTEYATMPSSHSFLINDLSLLVRAMGEINRCSSNTTEGQFLVASHQPSRYACTDGSTGYLGQTKEVP
ncbi:hypothetical protein AMS68_007078 [Peltaster fructicola]|uniref:Uncharacterized protein n=1 Tax=Peltaster fructicola TaxID=286661 RepID=A0A6H0Y3R6_9PEZI|nr:hypothetical protein AMS68_007078 [Peltaster fructicola]